MVDFYYAIAGSVALGPDIVELGPATGCALKALRGQQPDAQWGLAYLVVTALEHWHVEYYGPGTHRGPVNTSRCS